MYLGGDTDPPAEYAFLPLDDLRRELPADAAERVLVALDCANAQRMGRRRRCSTRCRSSLDIDHHHDNTRVREDQPCRPRSVVDRRDRPRHPARAGRRSDAGDRRGALRRARHRHRPLPVHQHLAEGPAAGGGARGGRRRRPPRVPGHLRVGRVREAQAARAGARARGDPRGRPARHLAPQADGLHRPRRGGGVRRGDHRLPPRCGRHGHGGGHPRAARASGREAAREPARIARRARRVGDRPRAWGRRPSPSGRVLERASRSRRSRRSSSEEFARASQSA